MQDRIWIETIARVIASCRERNLNTPDRIASAIGKELSSYENISGEFERAYAEYGRFARAIKSNKDYRRVAPSWIQRVDE